MDGLPTQEVPEVASPQLTALRTEAGILHNIFSVLGQATIRAHECKRAAEVLDYIQSKIDAFEAAIAEQVKLEAPPTEDKETSH